MKMLFAGVLVFAVLHWLPAAAPGFRKRLAGGMGDNVWKGLFTLLIIGSITLMVVGWRSSEGVEIYRAPEWGYIAAFICMLAMSVMFFAPYMNTNFRRLVRHSQLTGIVLFGIGHLAAAGNLRTIVLFGGLAAWAFLEILFLNRRDGVWEKPEPVSRAADVRLLVAGTGFFLIFLFMHEAFFGSRPLPF
ncbi:MAG: hypothetical protein GWM87_07545 [Xanthomonadales bacterium]|nr:hypothetical protein [Xanthomonadales bacterium]NIX12801.1 hypothetical protein [Xanthomonadales bacterium]